MMKKLFKNDLIILVNVYREGWKVLEKWEVEWNKLGKNELEKKEIGKEKFLNWKKFENGIENGEEWK